MYGLYMGRLAYGKSDISCSINSYSTSKNSGSAQPALFHLQPQTLTIFKAGLRMANAIRPTVKGLYMVAVLQNCNLLIPKIVRDRYRTVQVLAVILRTKKTVSQN